MLRQETRSSEAPWEKEHTFFQGKQKVGVVCESDTHFLCAKYKRDDVAGGYTNIQKHSKSLGWSLNDVIQEHF